MLYRIAARCDTSVVAWESKYTASYDTSGKGCSALQAALLRASLAEVSVALNSHAGGVFHDFSKFFDTINVQSRIEQAISSAFPHPALNFAVSTHLSPRTIQCVVRRSVEPGDKPLGIAFPQITYHYS